MVPKLRADALPLTFPAMLARPCHLPRASATPTTCDGRHRSSPQNRRHAAHGAAGQPRHRTRQTLQPTLCRLAPMHCSSKACCCYKNPKHMHRPCNIKHTLTQAYARTTEPLAPSRWRQQLGCPAPAFPTLPPYSLLCSYSAETDDTPPQSSPDQY
jgi:hypothetical protein